MINSYSSKYDNKLFTFKKIKFKKIPDLEKVLKNDQKEFKKLSLLFYKISSDKSISEVIPEILRRNELLNKKIYSEIKTPLDEIRDKLYSSLSERHIKKNLNKTATKKLLNHNINNSQSTPVITNIKENINNENLNSYKSCSHKKDHNINNYKTLTNYIKINKNYFNSFNSADKKYCRHIILKSASSNKGYNKQSTLRRVLNYSNKVCSSSNINKVFDNISININNTLHQNVKKLKTTYSPKIGKSKSIKSIEYSNIFMNKDKKYQKINNNIKRIYSSQSTRENNDNSITITNDINNFILTQRESRPYIKKVHDLDKFVNISEYIRQTNLYKFKDTKLNDNGIKLLEKIKKNYNSKVINKFEKSFKTLKKDISFKSILKNIKRNIKEEKAFLNKNVNINDNRDNNLNRTSTSSSNLFRKNKLNNFYKDIRLKRHADLVNFSDDYSRMDDSLFYSNRKAIKNSNKEIYKNDYMPLYKSLKKNKINK